MSECKLKRKGTIVAIMRIMCDDRAGKSELKLLFIVMHLFGGIR